MSNLFTSLTANLITDKRSIASELQTYEIGQTLLAPGNFSTFNKPTEILVSRWFPGYRVADLSGEGADEAVGVLLATSLTEDDDLDTFRRILATPDIAMRITTTLLPRAGVPVKRGKGYLVSDKRISAVVADTLKGMSTRTSVAAAISHVFTRIFSHLDIAMLSTEERTVNVSESFVIKTREMRRFVMIESMRDMFTEQRLATATRELNSDATPELIAEVIAKLLRETSRLIPEVKLRLEHLKMTTQLITAYQVSPNDLSKTMQASTALQTLSNYANFLADATGFTEFDLPTHSNDDMKAAVTAIAEIIASAPSMEPMPLMRYASLFGMTPASSSEGVFRGGVVYLPLGQTSKMDVVDASPRPDGAELSLVMQEYTPVTTIAAELSRTLASPAAMMGIANIIADELTYDVSDIDAAPILHTIGLGSDDLKYLAMALSDVTTVVLGPVGQASLVYGVSVNERWLMRVQAATSSIAYFDNPAAAVAYKMAEFPVEPGSLPSRQQHLNLVSSYDQVFRGDMARFLVEDISSPFKFALPLRNPIAEGGLTSLNLSVIPLATLSNADGSVVDRGEARYVAIREPGVDRDVEIVLSLANAYATSDNIDLADKARSWIIENMITLVTHPAIQREASRSLNQSIKDAQLDGRRLAAQLKPVLMKAYFGTLTATLARFGKIPGALASELMTNVPVDGLTVKARIALASIPTTMTNRSLLEK